MKYAPTHREKPKPFKWHCNEHGIVEYYDFQYYKRSGPPPVDAEPVTLKFRSQN